MIYFVQEEGLNYIKIGYSQSPGGRLDTLQTGSPSKLHCLLIIEGDMAFEKLLHQMFAAYRVCGEWFKPSPEILQFIISRKDKDAVKEPSKWPLKIYLAGKICGDVDWRKPILGGQPLLGAEDANQWPEHKLINEHTYVGPYFINANKFGWLPYADSHGAHKEQEIVSAKCFNAIERCDLLFAWIDSIDCYGTLVEIGYAKALKKIVWVTSSRRTYRDLWLAFSLHTQFESAHSTCYPSAKDALEDYLYRYKIETCGIAEEGA